MKTKCFDFNAATEATWLTESLKLLCKKMPPTFTGHQAIERIGVANVVKSFVDSTDHGLPHSKLVWQNALAIAEQCPKLIKSIRRNAQGMPLPFETLFYFPALMHDLGRFLGYSTADHEHAGAVLARTILKLWGYRVETYQSVWRAIIHHDYFSPRVNGRRWPPCLQDPFADIFRLADKTSVSPADEVQRYYDTSVRYKTPFFNPDLSAAQRFDFRHNRDNRDMVTWFLMIFILRPADFAHVETRRFYRSWSATKDQAVEAIRRLAAKQTDTNNQPVNVDKVMSLIKLAQV